MRTAAILLMLFGLSGFSLVAAALNYGLRDQVCFADLGPAPTIPRTAPIPVGCEVVDCCPGCPAAGPFEWKIDVDADIVNGAELRFEGLTAAERKRLRVTGAAKPMGDHFRLLPGSTRIRGLPHRAGGEAPVGMLHPTINPQGAQSLPRGPSGSVADRIRVQQFLGSYLVNAFNWDIVISRCRGRPPKPPTPPTATNDKLRITGLAPGEDAVVMLDHRVSASCRDKGTTTEEVFKSTGETVFVDNLLSPASSCNSEIAVFSKNHAMKWEPIAWTDAPGDIRTVTLDPPINVEVHVWVINDATAVTAQAAVDRARDLFRDNRVGVLLNGRVRKLSDVSSDTNAFNIVKSATDFDGTNCLDGAGTGLSAIKAAPYYTPNTLNVYYVDKAFRGRNCAIKPLMGSCSSSTTMFPPGDANISFIGSTADPSSLVHELGHAYGLRPAACGGHTELISTITKDNIMCTGTCLDRTTLTLGQVFRMNTQADPWGGSVLIPNNIPARVPRACPLNLAASGPCPALDRSWP